jgi:transposase-like protein
MRTRESPEKRIDLSSRVSRLCQEIDERVNAFLNRPLEGD